MLVKEYLRQAYFLDQRIKADMMECEELRKMAESISSQASRSIIMPVGIPMPLIIIP